MSRVLDISPKDARPTLVFAPAVYIPAYTVALMGGVVSPSRPMYWFQVIAGVVYWIEFLCILVMEKDAALTSP